jgi:hypothetical protein
MAKSVIYSKIAILFDTQMQAGIHQIQWKNESLPAGIYFCCLMMDGKLYIKDDQNNQAPIQ